MAGRKVFILGGYSGYAAGHMVYHIGRVLEERFGYEPVVVRVGTQTPESSPFKYPKLFPVIELRELQASVSREDLFLPIAAAWEACFGLTLGCRKLLYVQGANTFKVLDGFMDGYVSVSAFVQQTLKLFYDIESPVICPFVETESFPEPLAWEEREPGSTVIFVKPPQIAGTLVNAFLSRLSARHPDVKLAYHVIERGVPHADLMALLSRTRYVIALSPTEGFGVLPLEAMASGCAVAAFHGGGGLEYMTDANSRAVGYPHLDQLVNLFAEVYRDPALAKSLAHRARVDAQHFSRNRFDSEWSRYLTEFGA